MYFALSTLRQYMAPMLRRPYIGLAPFSTFQPKFTESSIIVPEKQFPLPPGPITNGNMIEKVTMEEIERLDPTGEKRALVLRKSKTRIKPGDVVLVESYTSRTKGTTTRFMGICIALYRKGIDTSILLRNIIERVGVEMRFPVYSPMVKRIEILRRGEGYRRAKLFYLRRQPGKAFRISGMQRQESSEKTQ
jgi:large subunit ribosomal protein L19